MRVLLALALFAFPINAEEGQTPGGNQPIIINTQPQQTPQLPSWNRGGILNDDVFKSVGRDTANEGPSTTKSPYSGTVRSRGAEPDYNYRQREQWMDACKGKDPAALRECFAGEKKKSQDAEQASREMVERRQGQPLRNTQGLIPGSAEPEGDESFGGAESQSEEESSSEE